MKKYRPIIIVGATVLMFVGIGWYLLRAAHFDVFSPAGQVAEHERNLLVFVLSLSGIVVIPVFTLLAIFTWRYRQGTRAKYHPEWADNTTLEVIWWGIPIMIIIVLAITAVKTSHTLDPYRPIQSDAKTIEIEVVALQWKWLFIYPEYDIATVNKLIIPEQTPVHFTISADAPMSAFWIPSMGSQIYAMNGMSSQLNLYANRTGKFQGYNTNINGPGYADMTFVADVRTNDEFHQWTVDALESPELSDAEFAKMSQPSVVQPQQFALNGNDIYAKVIDKFMPAGMMDNHNMGGM